MLVRRADHRRLDHGRVRVEHVLDVLGIDVLPAGDDHVLLAVDDEQVAVLVTVADVAGVKPAVADRRRGRLGRAPVLADHRGRADQDLAQLPGSQVGAVFADHAHLGVDRLAAGRCEPALARRLAVEGMVVRSQEGRLDRLRQPVALRERAADRLDRAAQDRQRHRPAAVEHEPQRAEVVGAERRRVQQRVEHRRDEQAGRRALALDRRQHLTRLEALQDRVRAAQRRVGRGHEQRAHVVERRDRQVHVGRVGLVGDRLVVDVALEVSCVTTAPFGSPVVPLVYMIAKGSSAPGPSPGGSAEAPSNADSYSSPKRSRQPGARRVGVLRPEHDPAHLGVRQQRGPLVLEQPEVERHRDRPALGQRPVGLEVAVVVVGEDRDALTGRDVQRVREPVHPRIDLAPT